MAKHKVKAETHISKKIFQLQVEIMEVEAKLVEDMPFAQHIELIRYRRVLRQDLADYSAAKFDKDGQAEDRE